MTESFQCFLVLLVDGAAFLNFFSVFVDVSTCAFRHLKAYIRPTLWPSLFRGELLRAGGSWFTANIRNQ